MHTHTHYRRYALVFIIAFGALLAGLGGFNYIVDPLNFFAAPKATGIDAYKPFGSQRTHKLAQVERGDWQAVIVGSSRAAVGLNPEHPMLPSGRTYNAGLNGAEITEIIAAATYAIDHNGLDLLVLLLDPAYFNPNSRPAAVFTNGPHHPDFSRSNAWARMLLGMETTSQSFEAISTSRRRTPPEMNALGHRVAPIASADTGHHAMFIKQLADLASQADGSYESDGLSLLGELVEYAFEHEVRVVIGIAPCHASRLVQIDRLGHWESYGWFKRDLIALQAGIERKYSDGPGLRLIDFAVLDGRTTGTVPDADDASVQMPWFYEPVHFKAALGDLVLDALLSDPDTDGSPAFGVDLRGVDIEEHMDRQLELLDVYEAFHPAELRGLGIADR